MHARGRRIRDGSRCGRNACGSRHRRAARSVTSRHVRCAELSMAEARYRTADRDRGRAHARCCSGRTAGSTARGSASRPPPCAMRLVPVVGAAIGAGPSRQRDIRIMSAAGRRARPYRRRDRAVRWHFDDEGDLRVLDGDGKQPLEAALEHHVDHLGVAERDGGRHVDQRYVLRADGERDVEAGSPEAEIATGPTSVSTRISSCRILDLAGQ